MLGSLANAWKVPELRTRLMFTAALIALYRLGAFVPLPGISREAIASATAGVSSHVITSAAPAPSRLQTSPLEILSRWPSTTRIRARPSGFIS